MYIYAVLTYDDARMKGACQSPGLHVSCLTFSQTSHVCFTCINNCKKCPGMHGWCQTVSLT